jgi:hypothetical protein
MYERRNYTKLPGDDLKRILACLDSIDAGLINVNARLEKLEARAYDTKPIREMH